MAADLALGRRKGGNNHPLSSKQFILDHLALVGENYIGGLHIAYRKALDEIARSRRREYYYHHPTYYSFSKKVWELITAGIVEFSGREEPSDDHRFATWKEKPMRRFVRLAKK